MVLTIVLRRSKALGQPRLPENAREGPSTSSACCRAMLRLAPLRRSDRDYYSQASLRAKKMTVAATRRPRSCGHIGWSWRVWMACQSFCLQVGSANVNDRCMLMLLSYLAAPAFRVVCSHGLEQIPTGDHRAGTDDRALLDRTAPGGQSDLAKVRGGTEVPLDPQNPE